MIKLLRLNKFPILKQLQIEEAIYRTPNAGNWIILNNGTPEPIVIVGISGKAEQLVNLKQAESKGIQTMKRFSGGGTVIADENTIFSSILLEFETFKKIFPQHIKYNQINGIEQPFYPKDIMNWSANSFYNNVFHDQLDFKLQEHDYAFGEKKFGGNAQSFSKYKFLHHTSFLFDFKDENMMQYLKQPDKIPEYRKDRDHLSFLCKLKDRYQSPDNIFNNFINTINNLSITNNSNTTSTPLIIQNVTLEEAESYLSKPHTRSNQLFDYNLKIWKDINNEYNINKN